MDIDIDESTNFKLVADCYMEGEHEMMDNYIHQIYEHMLVTEETISHLAPILLNAIFQHYTIKECQDFIVREPKLEKMILDGWNNGFKSIRLMKLFQPTFEREWKAEYIGDAASTLWTHIENCYQGKTQYHANYCAIVQSSGTGKSRAVDEMGKYHLVIPVNLRESSSSGYPPSDAPAHNWFSDRATQRHAFLASCSFLHALFLETARVLRDIKKQQPVAAEFQSFMNEGMMHQAHGKQRKGFYQDVINRASDLYSTWLTSDKSACRIDEILARDDFSLCKAFDELCQVIESPTSNAPSVILAFDEIHTMTQPHDNMTKPQDNDSWSRFGELRRAIQTLGCKPLFTVFISTSETLCSVIAVPSYRFFGRTFRNMNVASAFCELGFDHHVEPISFLHPVKLTDITSVEYLSTYGRPLWASYKGMSNVIDFAAMKLLGGTSSPLQGQCYSNDQKLACLAQRIPIEFLSMTYGGQVSDGERDQVRWHMRMALMVDNQHETMVTTSPSEPILSEAAYSVMTGHPGFSVPQALQDILDVFAVHKGELGERVVALLFILARDRVVRDTAFTSPNLLNYQRWCSLTGLLKSLFNTPSSFSVDHVDVVDSPGWLFKANENPWRSASLGEQFKDSKVYFTHFVKVHQQQFVGVQSLMCMMVRGAAILCANSQLGIDGIIPFLLSGDEIREDNIGVIMFQVTRNAHYTHDPEPRVFHDMRPSALQFKDSTRIIPVIRTVFALAAKKPRLALVDHGSIVNQCTADEECLAYDFWVAGFCHSLLGPVAAAEQAIWDSILQPSRPWDVIYGKGAQIERLRRSMHPGTAEEDVHWQNWCEEVPRVR